jgi:hypothetical protein
MVLGVEEVRAAQVPRQCRLLGDDVLDANRAVDLANGVVLGHEAAGGGLEAAAERRYTEMLDAKADRRMNRVDRPGAGRELGGDCGGHRSS